MNLRPSFSSLAEHCIFLSEDNQLYSWGYNVCEALGFTNQADYHCPTLLPFPDPPSNIVSFASGIHHNLALMKEGSWYAWGNNFRGQLGIYSAGGEPAPITQVKGGTPEEKFTKVRCGSNSSFGITERGVLYAWGDNTEGQLGLGSDWSHCFPKKVGLPGPVRDVASGTSHTVILLEDGQVFACGNNNFGQITHFGSSKLPKIISSLPPITHIACGSAHSLAISREGALYAWGWNLYGSIGNGRTGASVFEPALVLPSGVRTCACGHNFSVALLESGELYSWGYNGQGQLGLGHSRSVHTPELIKFQQIPQENSDDTGNPANSGKYPKILTITCSGETVSILTETGIMWSWGMSRDGQATWSTLFRHLSPMEHPERKWKLPVFWDSIFRWLWLGRLGGREEVERGSGFKDLPVEVLFNMVGIICGNHFL